MLRGACIATVLALSLLIVVSRGAHAEGIRIGIILSETGTAASLGIPQRDTVPLLGNQISGQPVLYTVLDDGSDPIRAKSDAIALADQDQVDLIIGPSTTPAALEYRRYTEFKKTAWNFSGSSATLLPQSSLTRGNGFFKRPSAIR